MFIVNAIHKVNYLIYSIIYPFQLLGSMLAPIFKFKVPPWLRYFLELGLVIGVMVLAFFLNYWLDLPKHLDKGPKELRPFWLPMITVLLYAAVRLFIFIVQQIPSPTTAFPDIDLALTTGLEALHEARVNLQDAPLFLVVGLTAEAEAAFTQSSLIAQDVRVTGRDLPVHWFGNDRGLWLTLPGVSALAHQTELAARSGGHAARGGYVEDGAPRVAGGRFATVGGADAGGDMMLAAPGGGSIPGGGGNRFSTLAGGDSVQPFATAGGDADGPPPVQSEGYRTPTRRMTLDEKELAGRRIEYFVKALRELRYPICPVNGVLLVLPYEWTTSPGLSQLADTAKVDMLALQQNLGVKCLCITVFSGIEKSPEFVEYVNRLDKSQHDRRCGCGFPPLMNPAPADIDRSHGWLVNYFERQIFELYQRGLGDQGNGKLFRFLDSFRKSKSNFARLLHHAFPQEASEPFYLGGVYYAGIGQVGNIQHPFFDGVLAKLQREHDDVIGWNDQTMIDDRRFNKASGYVMAGVVVLTIVNALLVLSIIFKWKW